MKLGASPTPSPTSDERNRFDIDPKLIAGSEIHELLERLGQDTQGRHCPGTDNRYCCAAQSGLPEEK